VTPALKNNPALLLRLAERIRDIEQGSHPASLNSRGNSRGGGIFCPVLGLAAGGLQNAAIHEWYGTTGGEGRPAAEGHKRQAAAPEPCGWLPPLGVLARLVPQAWAGAEERGLSPGEIVWVGRQCWPYGWALAAPGGRGPKAWRQSLFVDPPDDACRLWAIDLALRCPAVAVVVADGSRLDMAATRRLQLAARAGGALGLLVRPLGEIKELSAAATRWRVEPQPSPTHRPRWSIHLLRCKGVRPASDPALEHTAVVVEWDREKGLIRVPARLVGRSDTPPPPPLDWLPDVSPDRSPAAVPGLAGPPPRPRPLRQIA
jgi:hypothetical protein